MEEISVLIKVGANLDTRYGIEGATPLMIAANTSDNPTLIAMLSSTDISIKDRKTGKTALDLAKENPAFKDNLAVLELLGEKSEPKKPAPKK